MNTSYDPFSEYDEATVEMLRQAEELKANGEFRQSIQLLESLITNDPACAIAYEELGDNYLSTRELNKSKKALDQAIRLNDKSANAHYLKGFLASLQQNWNASVTALSAADNLFPNHPEILRCLGWSMYNDARRAQGMALLERSNVLSPDDINIMCDLGVCYMNSSKTPLAVKLFQKVLKQAPDSPQAIECKQFLDMIQQRKKTIEG